MARVGSADRSNPRGVAGSSEPIMDRGPDLATLHGRLAYPMVASNEQHEPVAGVLRTLEREVDRLPCAVQAVPVKIDDAIRLR
jgi:hypothetical protein